MKHSLSLSLSLSLSSVLNVIKHFLDEILKICISPLIETKRKGHFKCNWQCWTVLNSVGQFWTVLDGFFCIFNQVELSEQTLFNSLILGKSRFPEQSFITSTTGFITERWKKFFLLKFERFFWQKVFSFFLFERDPSVENSFDTLFFSVSLVLDFCCKEPEFKIFKARVMSYLFCVVLSRSNLCFWKEA